MLLLVTVVSAVVGAVVVSGWRSVVQVVIVVLLVVVRCLLWVASLRVRLWWCRSVWMGEFVDMPFPNLFVQGDVDPIADFAIWIVSLGGGDGSCFFASCCYFFACFIR